MFLVSRMRMVSGADFTFQSSLQGGRLELGGIVADFIFPYQMIIIQVQGPTHTEYLRMQKDREQKNILQDMGYYVYDLDEDLIYNRLKFEDRMKQIFRLSRPGGGGGSQGVSRSDGDEDYTPEDIDLLYEAVLDLEDSAAALM